MSERSSFSIEPNLNDEAGVKAEELYLKHKQDPNNPQPIEEAKSHYEENTEAYHNQAAMDMSAAGKDVNTAQIKTSTTLEDGVTTRKTTISGDLEGDVNVEMGSGDTDARKENVVRDLKTKGKFTINQKS